MGQLKIVGIAAVLAVFLASLAIYTVDQTQRAILFRLGKIVEVPVAPGIHVKTPFINNVRKFDIRIQTLEAEPERYLTKEKKNLLVDSFVKWRITDVARYYTSTGGDGARAGSRLYQIVKDGLRGEFGKRTINEVVSGDRAEIMNPLIIRANEQMQIFGIEVVDIRLRRVDLPPDVSISVFQRMRAERARAAKDSRARGAEAGERIRADADRQRTVILANAFAEAEQLRGEGDATAANTYATVYGNDAEFYALYRSLNAYKNTFSDKSDMIVIKPDSEFFKYFKNPQARPADQTPAQ
jgi:membrane protease subunit HflC